MQTQTDPPLLGDHHGVTPPKFDPFESRSDRDIRNALSKGFLQALETHDSSPLDSALENLSPTRAQEKWIKDRMARYTRALSHPISDLNQPLTTAALLWDLQLFFECHEWLEDIWLGLKGEKKKALQGLIRACGAYAMAEASRPGPAQKSAKKAMALLKTHRDQVPKIFQVDDFLKALAQWPLPARPPRLGILNPGTHPGQTNTNPGSGPVRNQNPPGA